VWEFSNVDVRNFTHEDFRLPTETGKYCPFWPNFSNASGMLIALIYLSAAFRLDRVRIHGWIFSA
jgi:hypothetical protein